MTKPKKISIIVAMDPNNLIGGDNKLLWDIPEDLERFKKLTMGKPVIMGRKTYESIGHPLQGRTNVVITTDKDYHAYGILAVQSLEEALRIMHASEEVFIIGGGSIYEQALQYANRMYVTKVLGTFEGDTYFPDFHEVDWRVNNTLPHLDAQSGLGYIFIDYTRI